MNRFWIIAIISIVLFSCAADEDYQGMEYAPNMYHSVPYEPLKQITNEDAGNWVSSIDNGVGEYYNSNPHNPFDMTMRKPADGTVRYGTPTLPYRVHKDSLDYAAANVQNPLPDTAYIVKEGEILYGRFCTHCHGENGQGSMDETAKVGEVYKGVPAYNAGRVAELSEGHIFHVITHGKGRMGAHGSQIDIMDRWKIVRYVQELQEK